MGILKLAKMKGDEGVNAYLRAWWRVTHWSKVTALLGVVVVILWLQPNFKFTQSNFNFDVLIFLLMMCGPAIMMLIRKKRSPCVVLWLRRFHRGAASKSLLRFWEGVVQPWGQVITLSDADIKRPRTVLWLLFMICAIAPWVTMWNEVRMLRHTTIADSIVMLILGSVLAALMGGTYSFLSKKFSVATLRNETDSGRVLSLVRKMRSSALMFWSGGSGFVQCPPDDDNIWRMAISALAPEVCAVILDYGTGISANIEWEVSTLLKVCGERKLILAIPAASNGSNEFESTMQRLFGGVLNLSVIQYPQKIPRIAISKAYESIVRPAQLTLGLVTHGGSS